MENSLLPVVISSLKARYREWTLEEHDRIQYALDINDRLTVMCEICSLAVTILAAM